LRHPFLLAAELAVAQAASGGRVEVGIGADSHHFARYDHEALGIRFPDFTERIGRLDACCPVLPALWRGEHVTDEATGLRDASLGTLGIAPPPILVGGKSERAMIAVSSDRATGPSRTEAQDGTPYVMNADGSGVRHLLDLEAVGLGDRTRAWITD
jgi:alkanesulfonate monooxygenase SsuD/methylene tetrahydromethanopterin reductase-like flavin-dependent oxidoreductase (luciferase family)